jgi:hypothetical protein
VVLENGVHRRSFVYAWLTGPKKMDAETEDLKVLTDAMCHVYCAVF